MKIQYIVIAVIAYFIFNKDKQKAVTAIKETLLPESDLPFCDADLIKPEFTAVNTFVEPDLYVESSLDSKHIKNPNSDSC